MEKRLLQLAILVGGIVPVAAGFEGATRGALFMGRWPGQGADSEFRYLSGLLLGIGLLLWGCVPTIERRTTIVRTATFFVVIGGLSRLYGWIVAGDPGNSRWALGMELVVTPLICLWQTRIAQASDFPHRKSVIAGVSPGYLLSVEPGVAAAAAAKELSRRMDGRD